ncbi:MULTISPECIES: nucleotidyltransferase domain-containing protein [unclassified Streptomyces]|uniref:nucleotidyltransferase domain-containing protein n=1 Tax=unclassified Streptomyces TaxID=2593676 RepID=UPI002256950D|nr:MULTISPECIES: nucleotidyltransferase domain-containing protein [unclassified Streptomyces]MCX4527002.1 nucleotidyltransferase domain-containing protein [Streptomyces sp. NBC_01551]MCX4542438.1 nucleotidyltransferase domain-containing protein [Streptomyces sp. NBC_01565]
MTFDFTRCLDEVSGRGLLPADHRAAFVVGSLARGWANPSSDVDIYVVTDEPWTGAASGSIRVPLTRPDVPTAHFPGAGDGRRRELKYWTDGQIGEVLAKVSWAEFDAGRSIGQMVTRDEEQLLERLLACRPLSGEDWVRERQREIEQSAFRAVVVSYCLTNADDFVEDALGQLAVDDLDSAVLSVRQAFGHAVDALLASHGECGRLVKWRARRMAAARPEALPYERYWAVETMRDFDSAAPRAWVEDVITLCKSLSMEVEI